MHDTHAGVEPPPALAIAGFEVDMLMVEVGLEGSDGCSLA